ncbi:hypothetical protein Q1W70_20390 [Pseudomonas kielensis]|uniref:hypothetical protein n=1 Tax=Pseudomonas TaxID=286 RepID=UPI0014127448|nr:MULTISPECIES: hypothetical protein [Pseudomonas]NBB32737.1 hypothetical protein [Pseudomonas sp. BC115LW]UZM15991.1 hypothetical protein LZV00_09780 [Pseudomonas kielensis]WKL51803.1 hypothetical protein Q1W70_20390 [Pseudomonas kielensis]
MTKSNPYNTDPDVFALFEKALPKQGMFLIDDVLTRDLKVVSRSRDDQIEYSFIKSYGKNPGQVDFKVFIEGSRWGDLNGRLFDDISGLVAALRSRGLQHVQL